MNKIINEITKIIKNNNSFLILAHDNPDGDSIGSCLALGLALKKLNKKVHILLGGTIPTRYLFLPGIKKIILNSRSMSYPNKSDVIFTLDTAVWNQIAKYKDKQFKDKTVINIDHHIDNNKFGDINWVDPKASAVGEQIYYLIKKLLPKMTTEMAICLYTAITTDTGNFQYSNTTSKTHNIISQLLKFDFLPHTISKKIYENISFYKLKLLELSLKTIKKQDNIIWAWITNKMLKQSRAKMEDTEGFIDYLKSVSGIKIAIIFKECIKPNETRVTFRSKNNKIFVNELAHHFGGGGHPAAAGCTIYGNPIKTESKVIKKAKSFIEQKSRKRKETFLLSAK